MRIKQTQTETAQPLQGYMELDSLSESTIRIMDRMIRIRFWLFPIWIPYMDLLLFGSYDLICTMDITIQVMELESNLVQTIPTQPDPICDWDHIDFYFEIEIFFSAILSYILSMLLFIFYWIKSLYCILSLLQKLGFWEKLNSSSSFDQICFLLLH